MVQQPVKVRGKIKQRVQWYNPNTAFLPTARAVGAFSLEGGTELLSHGQSSMTKISLCTQGSQVRFPLWALSWAIHTLILSGAALSLVSVCILLPLQYEIQVICFWTIRVISYNTLARLAPVTTNINFILDWKNPARVLYLYRCLQ